MKKHFVIKRDLGQLTDVVPGVIKYTENNIFIEVSTETERDLRFARKSAQGGDEKLTPKN